MITATGQINGTEIEVLITDNRNYLFDGKEDTRLEGAFKEELAAGHHMGVFFPEKNSILNYINVLENYFFDYNTPSRTDEKVPEMESMKGVVY